jgi:hypothetical protein
MAYTPEEIARLQAMGADLGEILPELAEKTEEASEADGLEILAATSTLHVCPVCAGLVTPQTYERHMKWHGERVTPLVEDGLSEDDRWDLREQVEAKLANPAVAATIEALFGEEIDAVALEEYNAALPKGGKPVVPVPLESGTTKPRVVRTHVVKRRRV